MLTGAALPVCSKRAASKKLSVSEAELCAMGKLLVMPLTPFICTVVEYVILDTTPSPPGQTFCEVKAVEPCRIQCLVSRVLWVVGCVSSLSFWHLEPGSNVVLGCVVLAHVVSKVHKKCVRNLEIC
eukprot:1385378-Amphidinium_carterae.1